MKCDEKHYIRFVQTDYIGKTKKFNIVKISNDDIIGEIFWSCGWRRYVWTSYTSIQWSIGCTMDVLVFIDKLMYERSK